MAKIEAVECDRKSCGKLGAPADGAVIPEGWLEVQYYQEGEGTLEPRVFCSWACASGWATDRIVAAPRRKRRTRAQIEADRAATEADSEMAIGR